MNPVSLMGLMFLYQAAVVLSASTKFTLYFEPVGFVRSPIEMFIMKFDGIGIVEYIDTSNATYLYQESNFSLF